MVEEALPSHRSYMNSSLFHIWFDTNEHHWNELCKMSLWHDTEQAIFTTAGARSSQATRVPLSSDDESRCASFAQIKRANIIARVNLL